MHQNWAADKNNPVVNSCFQNRCMELTTEHHFRLQESEWILFPSVLSLSHFIDYSLSLSVSLSCRNVVQSTFFFAVLWYTTNSLHCDFFFSSFFFSKLIEAHAYFRSIYLQASFYYYSWSIVFFSLVCWKIARFFDRCCCLVCSRCFYVNMSKWVAYKMQLNECVSNNKSEPYLFLHQSYVDFSSFDLTGFEFNGVSDNFASDYINLPKEREKKIYGFDDDCKTYQENFICTTNGKRVSSVISQIHNQFRKDFFSDSPFSHISWHVHIVELYHDLLSSKWKMAMQRTFTKQSNGKAIKLK